jgi:hypothetical protein
MERGLRGCELARRVSFAPWSACALDDEQRSPPCCRSRRRHPSYSRDATRVSASRDADAILPQAVW